MNNAEYIEAVLKTESIPVTLGIDPISLHLLMTTAIHMGDLIDTAKKTIFYGKPLDQKKFADQAMKLASLGALVGSMASQERFGLAAISDFGDVPAHIANSKPDNVNVRLLHGAMGMYGETAELIKALKAELEGEDLDVVNFCEELGDIEWYRAVVMAELDASQSGIWEQNIAKLKKRYSKGTFSATEAVERDLAGERAVLEATQGATVLTA